MKIVFFKTKAEKLRVKLIKELSYNRGYSILRSSQTIKEDNEFLLRLAKQYDEYGYMSEELGYELDNLFKDKDYIIGIHRTGFSYMDDKTINSILDKGLINNGHMMYGGNTGYFDIEKTVSLFQEFTVFNGQLKSAHGYKGSQGCFIIKMPKSYLGKSNGDIKPIYYFDCGVVKLLPEFIYGYVPVDKEGKLGDIQRNKKYKDVHNLDNEHLMYEEGALYKAEREGIQLLKQKISMRDKYKIIEQAYQDTLLKYGKNQAEQALLNLLNENDVQYFTGQNNRELLSKYVIYGDILSILAINNPNLSNMNDIISSFFENANVILQEKNKLK